MAWYAPRPFPVQDRCSAAREDMMSQQSSQNYSSHNAYGSKEPGLSKLPPPQVALANLPLEKYAELYRGLVKKSTKVQPCTGLDENKYKRGDLQQILALHMLSAGNRNKKELLDRMVNLDLFLPFRSTISPRPPADLSGISVLSVKEVEEDLEALGWLEGSVVLLDRGEDLPTGQREQTFLQAEGTSRFSQESCQRLPQRISPQRAADHPGSEVVEEGVEQNLQFPKTSLHRSSFLSDKQEVNPRQTEDRGQDLWATNCSQVTCEDLPIGTPSTQHFETDQMTAAASQSIRPSAEAQFRASQDQVIATSERMVNGWRTTRHHPDSAGEPSPAAAWLEDADPAIPSINGRATGRRSSITVNSPVQLSETNHASRGEDFSSLEPLMMSGRRSLGRPDGCQAGRGESAADDDNPSGTSPVLQTDIDRAPATGRSAQPPVVAQKNSNQTSAVELSTKSESALKNGRRLSRGKVDGQERTPRRRVCMPDGKTVPPFRSIPSASEVRQREEESSAKCVFQVKNKKSFESQADVCTDAPDLTSKHISLLEGAALYIGGEKGIPLEAECQTLAKGMGVTSKQVCAWFQRQYSARQFLEGAYNLLNLINDGLTDDKCKALAVVAELAFQQVEAWFQQRACSQDLPPLPPLEDGWQRVKEPEKMNSVSEQATDSHPGPGPDSGIHKQHPDKYQPTSAGLPTYSPVETAPLQEEQLNQCDIKCSPCSDPSSSMAFRPIPAPEGENARTSKVIQVIVKKIEELSRAIIAADEAEMVPRKNKLGRKIAAILLEDFEIRRGRNPALLKAGVHIGTVVEATGKPHDPDLCPRGCKKAHELFFVRFPASESQRKATASGGACIDLKVDLHDDFRLHCWTDLKSMALSDPDSLPEAWVLLSASVEFINQQSSKTKSAKSNPKLLTVKTEPEEEISAGNSSLPSGCTSEAQPTFSAVSYLPELSSRRGEGSSTQNLSQNGSQPRAKRGRKRKAVNNARAASQSADATSADLPLSQKPINESQLQTPSCAEEDQTLGLFTSVPRKRRWSGSTQPPASQSQNATQDQVQPVGSVVWVRSGCAWWPGEVIDPRSLSESEREQAQECGPLATGHLTVRMFGEPRQLVTISSKKVTPFADSPKKMNETGHSAPFKLALAQAIAAAGIELPEASPMQALLCESQKTELSSRALRAKNRQAIRSSLGTSGSQR